MKTRYLLIIFGVFCRCLFASSAIYADSNIGILDVQKAVNEQNNLIIKEQNRLKYDSRLREQERQNKDRLNVEYHHQKPSTSNIQNAPQFKISSITLKGASSLPVFTKQRLIRPYLNQNLTINTINELIRNITNQYIKLGYVTARLYIPKQNLKDGSLVLQVKEGKIEDIEIIGADPKQLLTAFPGLKGNVLNMRDIEQGLDQMNRLQSSRATIKLIPSQSKVGGTIVQISQVPNKSGSARIRYDTLSEQQLQLLPNSFDVSYDNLLNLNDYLGLNYSQRFQGQSQYNNSIHLSTSLPYGYLSMNMSYSQFDYMMLIQGLNRNFTSSGKTKTIKSELDLVLHRNGYSKTALKTGITLKDVESFVEDAKSDVGSRKLTVFHLGLHQSMNQFFGNWIWNISLVKGLPENAIKDTPPMDLSSPRAQYQKITGDLYWIQTHIVFDLPIRSQSRFHGEYSAHTLYPSERMTLGDFSSVRGYDRMIQGDSGCYLTNEFSVSLLALTKSLLPIELTQNIQLYTALEAGIIRKKGGVSFYGPEGKGYMSSGVVGLRYFSQSGTQFECVFSKAIKASSYIRKPKYMMYMSLSKALF